MAKIVISYANVGVEKDTNAILRITEQCVQKGHFVPGALLALRIIMMTGKLNGDKVIVRVAHHFEMDKLIGFSLITSAISTNRILVDLRNADMELSALAVADDWRGYKVGKMLLEDSVRILRAETEDDGGRVIARVHPVSIKMRRMLEKNGFSVIFEKEEVSILMLTS